MKNKHTKEQRIAGEKTAKENLATHQTAQGKILDSFNKSLEEMNRERMEFDKKSLSRIFTLHNHLVWLRKLELFVYQRGIVGMKFIGDLMHKIKGEKPS